MEKLMTFFYWNNLLFSGRRLKAKWEKLKNSYDAEVSRLRPFPGSSNAPTLCEYFEELRFLDFKFSSEEIFRTRETGESTEISGNPNKQGLDQQLKQMVDTEMMFNFIHYMFDLQGLNK